MKHYKFTLLFFLLLFISCDVSTISDEKLNNLSNIKAQIYILDGTRNNIINDLKVYITDGDKQIINDQIKIILNEIPLNLKVQQELYYTKKSYYTLDDFPRSKSYYFEIILPDSTVYPLAFIKPQNINDSLVFNIPKTISINKDFTLNWKNINLPAELEVWKGVQNNLSGEHSGGKYSKTTIHKNINSKTGEYVLPKSYFKDSIGIARYLEIKLNHHELGLTNPKLLINSDIIYDFAIEKKVDIIE